MKNDWKNIDANNYIRKYKQKNISQDLALRIYTTQLLGKNNKLVLHGGGNTSLKTTTKNIFNEKINIMHVKGSGWDMGSIDSPGLPAVELEPLLKTKQLSRLNDFDMVNLQRKCLLDSKSPNPSVETLLHAFLPFKFIDHTHANAILSLIDQPNDVAICKKIFGNKMGIVPYVIPGFDLAKLAYKIFKKNEKVEGLILLNHGIFTFGNTAKESYDRMIKYVTIAEKKLSKYKNNIINRKKNIKINSKLNHQIILPLIRKNLSNQNDDRSYTKWIFDIRVNQQILNYLDHKDLIIFTSKGTVTPDHVIRTKTKPLIVNIKEYEETKIDLLLNKEIKKYKMKYKKYYQKNKKFVKNTIELDGNPRLIYIPKFGIIAIGRSKKEAKIAGDLAEATVDIISKAESLGKFTSISEKEIFKVEYWPLEQAKLKTLKRAQLTGNVTVISGGCGTIGLSIAREFLNHGSEVALLENNLTNIKNTPSDILKAATIIKCDVTNNDDVKKAISKVLYEYGGVDIMISNAGAAWQGDIGKVDSKILKESFDLNFYAHQYLSQACIDTMLKQNTGGVLLYNITKQAVNPGNNFGPYGIPKASTLFLMRQYTLEYGKHGIRSNGINADRIRSGLVTDKMIASRSKARNVTEKEYMSGNLLNQEVLAEDVGKAFLSLALAKKTTGDIMTVDGGNIQAVLR
jgi:rhamnose utilization protein RhaD (predicted bifunctional aldolase and dehydrogenase)/NAD(P)-dependent dehydrogenase (short-subunit alcohol dehydrogenase family)